MARKNPDIANISVNKLSEFSRARANRQRQILRDRKFPSDFKGMYYREATEAISSCLTSNLEDIGSVERTIRVLEQSTPEKIGTQRRIAANIDALESFLLMLDDIHLEGATPRLGPQQPPHLMIQNVRVSVRPEVLLFGNGKSGSKLVGAIKLHFAKTFPLDDDCAGMASAVVQEWCKVNLTEGQTYGPFCTVLDIGSKRVCPGVKSTVARMREVEANCRNITGLWPSIKPTED